AAKFRIFDIGKKSKTEIKCLSITGGQAFGAADAGRGGAILNEGFLKLTYCSLVDNKANRGGALSNLGIASIANCEFYWNRAVMFDGGAIENSKEMGIHGSELFANNAARNGGALFNWDNGEVEVFSTNIFGNEAGDEGGGVSTLGEFKM